MRQLADGGCGFGLDLFGFVGCFAGVAGGVGVQSALLAHCFGGSPQIGYSQC